MPQTNWAAIARAPLALPIALLDAHKMIPGEAHVQNVGVREGLINSEAEPFSWTPLVVLKVAALFLLAGFAEIGGGWLVWQAVREGKPWWWAVAGSVVLVSYGFVPTLQPLSDFGRLYGVLLSQVYVPTHTHTK